jgi:hypothetical protein
LECADVGSLLKNTILRITYNTRWHVDFDCYSVTILTPGMPFPQRGKTGWQIYCILGTFTALILGENGD